MLSCWISTSKTLKTQSSINPEKTMVVKLLDINNVISRDKLDHYQQLLLIKSDSYCISMENYAETFDLTYIWSLHMDNDVKSTKFHGKPILKYIKENDSMIKIDFHFYLNFFTFEYSQFNNLLFIYLFIYLLIYYLYLH